MYVTTIRIVESYAITNNEMWDTDSYRLWHDRLGHPGHDMMIRILKNSHVHPFFRVRNKRGQQSNTLQGVGPSTVQNQPLPSEVPKVLSPSHYASLTMSKTHHSFCKACSLAKIGSRPSYAKNTKENISFLQRIQGDICGPIHPECGPFRYFMVLVDASTRWSHVALLSTRNVAFAKLLAHIIRLRAHHPDHPIESIRLDNCDAPVSKTCLIN